MKGLIRATVEYIALKLTYDAVITVSESTKKKLLKYGQREDRIFVVYGGVDLELIDNISEDKNDIPTVIYVGRLVGHKKIDVLTSAALESISGFVGNFSSVLSYKKGKKSGWKYHPVK